MKKSLSVLRELTLLTTVLWSAPVFSQSASYYQGTISSVVNSASTNFAFRVHLDPVATACAASFLYINTSDSNYNTKVATLLTAYSLNKKVTLLAVKDSGNYCQTLDVQVD